MRSEKCGTHIFSAKTKPITSHFSPRERADDRSYLVQRPPTELSTGTIPFNASWRLE
jgi:hypothetical protein